MCTSRTLVITIENARDLRFSSLRARFLSGAVEGPRERGGRGGARCSTVYHLRQRAYAFGAPRKKATRVEPSEAKRLDTDISAAER
jgi:hypothetical protein